MSFARAQRPASATSSSSASRSQQQQQQQPSQQPDEADRQYSDHEAATSSRFLTSRATTPLQTKWSPPFDAETKEKLLHHLHASTRHSSSPLSLPSHYSLLHNTPITSSHPARIASWERPELELENSLRRVALVVRLDLEEEYKEHLEDVAREKERKQEQLQIEQQHFHSERIRQLAARKEKRYEQMRLVKQWKNPKVERVQAKVDCYIENNPSPRPQSTTSSSSAFASMASSPQPLSSSSNSYPHSHSHTHNAHNSSSSLSPRLESYRALDTRMNLTPTNRSRSPSPFSYSQQVMSRPQTADATSQSPPTHRHHTSIYSLTAHQRQSNRERAAALHQVFQHSSPRRQPKNRKVHEEYLKSKRCAPRPPSAMLPQSRSRVAREEIRNSAQFQTQQYQQPHHSHYPYHHHHHHHNSTSAISSHTNQSDPSWPSSLAAASASTSAPFTPAMLFHSSVRGDMSRQNEEEEKEQREENQDVRDQTNRFDNFHKAKSQPVPDEFAYSGSVRLHQNSDRLPMWNRTNRFMQFVGDTQTPDRR